MIKSLQSTAVWIADGDKAYDFYANKLGFKVLQDNPIPGGGRFLMFAPQGGGSQLIACTAVPGMPAAQVGGETPITWDTDDIHATYDELRAKGVEFPQPPTQQFWGGFQASFKDPDGNIYKLVQFKA